MPGTAPSTVLPDWIKPLPERFGNDDIVYLQNKGALTIPEEQLRDELLRAYAKFNHPFIPLIDLHQFVRTVSQYDGSQPVSLLLFQAIMFTGIATVDMASLNAAGYNSRREARRAFYNRTRLLYDLDYEDDSTAQVQALLLMTFWREDRDGRKETHHWIEVAVSLAQKIGLHRDLDVSPKSNPRSQQLRRRIWWSIYMRDMQIALGTGTSTRIKDVDFNVPMLQPSDFEMETGSDAAFTTFDCPVMQDGYQQLQLATLCVEMVKLSLCISHMLSLRHGGLASQGGLQTARMLFKEPPSPDDDHFAACDNAFRAWELSLPEAVRYIAPTEQDVQSGNDCVILSRTFLYLLRCAAISYLHSPRLSQLSSLAPSPAILAEIQVSRMNVRNTAASITALMVSLQSLRLIRFLPSPTITILVPAIATHLQDVLAPGESLSLKSLRDFSLCMQLMSTLREMYAAADYSTAFLQNAIQRADWRADAGLGTGGTDEERQRFEELPSQRRSSFKERRVSTPSQSAGSRPFTTTSGDADADHAAQRHNSEALVPVGMNDALHMGNMFGPSPPQMFDGMDTVSHRHSLPMPLPNGTTPNANIDFDLGAMQGEGNEFALDTTWLMGLDAHSMVMMGHDGSPGLR